MTLTDNYLNTIMYLKWLILALALGLSGWAATGLQRLEFTSDFKAFFRADDPHLQAYESLQNIYADTQNILFVLAPADGQVFTPKTLNAVARLTEAGWKLPRSTRVDSITNYQHSHAEGDDLIVEELLPRHAPLTPARIAQIRQIALQEPLLRGRLVAADVRVTAVNVAFLIDKNHPEQINTAVTAARDLKRRVEMEHPDITIHLTGSLMLDHAFGEASERDMSTLMPMMLGIVILLLWFMVGSLSAVLATTVVIVIAILATMGITGWMGIALTAPSAAAPPIILTIAVANSVHLLTHTMHALSQGYGRIEALRESLRVNLPPVALTNLTTCISFLTMNFSESPPFRDLGNIVALGVSITFLATVTVLPILLTLLPLRPREEAPWSERLLAPITEFSLRHRRSLLIGIAAIAAILIACIPHNELNDEYVKYFAIDSEFRQATEFTTKHLTGIYTIEYSLDAGEAGGISDPVFLRKMDGFVQWLRAQPEVIHVYTLTDILKRLNMNLNQDMPEHYMLPLQRDLAAQYLTLYEMSLPLGLDLNNIINVDKSTTRLTATLKNLSTRELLALEQRAAQWLDRHGIPAAKTPAVSPDIMFAHIGETNIRDMINGTIIEIVAITLILVIALRSWMMGLLSVIPNIIPAACAFGIWGLLVGQVNLAVSVVTGMTLGIIIDDTVHFLSGYLHARRTLKLDAAAAIRQTQASVGNALLTTSFILASGFAVLLLSSYEATAWMGMLTSLTILLALAAELFLMPAILMLLDRRRTY